MSNKTINDHQDTITQYMFLGLLPFFICAFGPWVFADAESVLTQLFILYSTIILAFLAGALWAIALFTEIEYRARHIHMAILISLWPLASYGLAYLMASSVYSIGLLLLGFLLLLFWEKCFINATYPNWYQALRHKITFIVVACHMLAIWNVIRVD